jgi:predicted GNAT family N-acyltransferase
MPLALSNYPRGHGGSRRSAAYDRSMEVVEFGHLTSDYRSQLQGDEQDPFDANGSTLQWRAKDRHVALRNPEGRLVASAGLLLAEIQVDDGSSIPVVGIGGVIVAAPYRGQGLATRTIREALRRAAALGPDLAILFCHRDRTGLYQRHGFVEVAPPVLVKQPDGFAEMPQVCMWRALHDGAKLPRGTERLLSHPF